MPVQQRTIGTKEFAATLRRRGIDSDGQRILLTRLTGSEQEADLSEPANCRGLGRIRHFRFESDANWSTNPLPIYPATRALSLPVSAELRAQVFQNAICNWRCWYCYVDFNRLAGDRRYSEFVSARELVDLFTDANPDACMIDLSGGQPDLVPEWVPWIMQELINRGLERKYYLWSDDNLSNYYFWEHLTRKQIELISAYPMYGRVGCFKGFDERSFSFNTAAPASEYAQQFDIFGKLLAVGFDLYAYVTFTTPFSDLIEEHVRDFCDRLQRVHPLLPLRTVPLKIAAFSPVKSRLNGARRQSIDIQQNVHDAWENELAKRFSTSERLTPITEVVLR